MKINFHLPKAAIMAAMMIGATLVSLPAKAASLSRINDIYVFGDSLSDTGNVLEATDGLLPPAPTYFNGRFADGPAWVEYLADDLGLELKQSNNFAFGGATTGFNNIALPDIISGLQQQVQTFTTTNTSVNTDALYIIWAGTNDYLDYALFGQNPNPNNSVANLSNAVNSLVNAGAKNLMVVNLPDLGKFPVTGEDNEVASNLTNFVKTHNLTLNQSLNNLRQNYSKDVNLIELDVYSLFNRILASPEEFGFTDARNSCIGDLSIVPVSFPRNNSIDCEPETFLFYDEVHPTNTANKLIGEYAFSTLKSKSVPESSAVPSLVMVSGLGIIYYSRKLKAKKTIGS